MGATIIPFPGQRGATTIPPFNWTVVEQARSTYHSKVPKIAVGILRRIAEAKSSSKVLKSGRWFLRLGLPFSETPVTVPRSDLADTPRLLEILDRLDRYGGHLAWGRLECRLDPAVKVPELLLFHPISNDMQNMLLHTLAAQADHRLSCSRWSVVGKELEDLDLLAVLIENEGKHYLGLLDKKSGIRMIDWLRAGHPLHLQAISTRLTPANDR